MKQQPIIRIETVNGDRTAVIGTITRDDLLGSMSSEGPDGHRRVIVFGWRDSEPGVWESTFGIDVETPDEREVLSTNMTRLSDLTEPYETQIHRREQAVTVRFTAYLPGDSP